MMADPSFRSFLLIVLPLIFLLVDGVPAVDAFPVHCPLSVTTKTKTMHSIGIDRFQDATTSTQLDVSRAGGRRYGPPASLADDDDGVMDGSRAPFSSRSKEVKTDEAVLEEFRALLDKVTATEKTEHIPGLLTRNLEFLLLHTTTYTITMVLEEAQANNDQETLAALEVVVSFIEEFVEQAQAVDKQNKEMVGKIVNMMKKKDEVKLDRFFRDHRQELTPAFVRHLEGECERIANAPKMTPESSRMLEMIYTIQTRVLEELGKVSATPVDVSTNKPIVV